MGYYFERASKNLLDAFQEKALHVYVWNGQKFVETTSNKLSFTFNHSDDMFAFSSVTYVLTKTDLFDGIPTLYSNPNSSKAITYIIPMDMVKHVEIEEGPNANRIICMGLSDMQIIRSKLISVI